MKEYEVFIDISEVVNIEAENEEEAKQKVYDMLSKTELVWGIDDAELSACEIEGNENEKRI